MSIMSRASANTYSPEQMLDSDHHQVPFTEHRHCQNLEDMHQLAREYGLEGDAMDDTEGHRKAGIWTKVRRVISMFAYESSGRVEKRWSRLTSSRRATMQSELIRLAPWLSHFEDGWAADWLLKRSINQRVVDGQRRARAASSMGECGFPELGSTQIISVLMHIITVGNHARGTPMEHAQTPEQSQQTPTEDLENWSGFSDDQDAEPHDQLEVSEAESTEPRLSMASSESPARALSESEDARSQRCTECNSARPLSMFRSLRRPKSERLLKKCQSCQRGAKDVHVLQMRARGRGSGRVAKPSTKVKENSAWIREQRKERSARRMQRERKERAKDDVAQAREELDREFGSS